MAALVRRGPDRAEHGVVRWRRVDLAAVIEARFGVRLAERTVSALLRRLGFVRLSVRSVRRVAWVLASSCPPPIATR